MGHRHRPTGRRRAVRILLAFSTAFLFILAACSCVPLPRLIVTVIESDSKTDPAQPNTGDRAAKLRSQQERQGMAYILCRQATSLLQRTRLNVTIACEAWHAKHARHMLLGSHLSIQSGRALTRLRLAQISSIISIRSCSSLARAVSAISRGTTSLLGFEF